MEMLDRTNSPLSGIVDRRKLEAFLKSPSDYGEALVRPAHGWSPDALPISFRWDTGWKNTASRSIAAITFEMSETEELPVQPAANPQLQPKLVQGAPFSVVKP